MCMELSNFMSYLVLRKYYCDISNNCQRLYTVITICYYRWDDTASKEVAVPSDKGHWTELWLAVCLLPTKNSNQS
jgi:hypothetical protein